MSNHSIEFPLLLEAFHDIVESGCAEKYMSSSLQWIGCDKPVDFLMSLVLMHIKGFEFFSHYKPNVKECRDLLSPLCYVYSDTQLKEKLEKIDKGTQTRNLFLLQKQIVKEQGSELCQDGNLNTLDVDWTVLTSFSEQREGSKIGCNKRYKGKPCFQLSLGFLGNIFADCKLCPGDVNPQVYFIKTLKRARSAGYSFDAVRGDAAFGNARNVLFLQEKLHVHYAIGASSRLDIIQQGRKKFRKLAHQGSSQIVHIDQGISAFDFGAQNIAKKDEEQEVYSRVIICRRVHRKKLKKPKIKKIGNRRKRLKWDIRYYYYAIVTDLDWTVRQVVKYYHQRQQIENAIKEVKYHYSLNRMPCQSLKGNEFFIASKIFAMTLIKLFVFRHLPQHLHHMRLKTLLRRVFASSLSQVRVLHFDTLQLKVDIKPKGKYSWHFKRIIKKLLEDHYRLFPKKLAA